MRLKKNNNINSNICSNDSNEREEIMAQSNVVRIDEVLENSKYYTLEEAREVIRAEAEFEQRRIAAEKERENAERKYFFKQKSAGVAMAGLAAASVLLTKDATAAFVLVPVGIFTFFTRMRIFAFGR